MGPVTGTSASALIADSDASAARELHDQIPTPRPTSATAVMLAVTAHRVFRTRADDMACGVPTCKLASAAAIVAGRSSGCLASMALSAASKRSPISGQTDDAAGGDVCTCITIVANADSPSKGTRPVSSSNASTPNE
jgi:hypothetical protein